MRGRGLSWIRGGNGASELHAVFELIPPSPPKKKSSVPAQLGDKGRGVDSPASIARTIRAPSAFARGLLGQGADGHTVGALTRKKDATRKPQEVGGSP